MTRPRRLLELTRKRAARLRKRYRATEFSKAVRRRRERASKRFVWQPLLHVITRSDDPRDRLLRAGPGREESTDLSRVRMRR
jgi:hypothetical protein